jgi:hypothetical protein
VSSKRQQTMAKLLRERLVKERRALKLEKKRAAREAKAAGGIPPTVADPGDADVDADVAESNGSPQRQPLA